MSRPKKLQSTLIHRDHTKFIPRRNVEEGRRLILDFLEDTDNQDI